MYPGKAVRRGDPRTEMVRLVQDRLVARGFSLVVDGDFGPKTEAAVKLVQTRFGLSADGSVGPVTWSALFGTLPATALAPTSALTGAALRHLLLQEGVRERGGPNRGPEVEKYLASVDKPPGLSWCVAIQYWGFDTAAKQLNVTNPLPKTAGVVAHWRAAPDKVKIRPDQVLDDLRLMAPGTLFCIQHDEDSGHMGMVLGVENGKLKTFEGNTNVLGSREGDGAYRRTRGFQEINLGFLDWGKA